ncbi:hypothetical protein [Flavimaricola marinus]|uniref:Clp protease n=1 Tax=Flavimaricola marinus TaxID=1819565 RepID=A0A238LDZ6_9RHOB|nr:hypothetical protein [Flavimaricola marinus]SMY07838.1 hypothetical protein LOM8899_01978 [Flavimaricola marinus]
MTDAAETPTGKHPVKRWLTAILALQCGMALILFGTDLMRVLPTLISPSRAPALDAPTAPGDQTRRYAPRDLTQRTPRPGTRPIPATEDMPTRLAFDTGPFDGGQALTLTGSIAPGDAERFADWLSTQTTPPDTIFLNSPGGSVGDALAIGRLIRAMPASTRMTETDVCLSACPYILAGGTTRQVEDGAWVGVHQHFFGENVALPAFLAVEDIQRGQGEVMAYLIEMEIDPAIMQHALVTPPDEIYLLQPDELQAYKLTSADGD